MQRRAPLKALASSRSVHSLQLDKTPMYEAAQRGRTEAVRLLLQHGAKVDEELFDEVRVLQSARTVHPVHPVPCTRTVHPVPYHGLPSSPYRHPAHARYPAGHLLARRIARRRCTWRHATGTWG